MPLFDSSHVEQPKAERLGIEFAVVVDDAINRVLDSRSILSTVTLKMPHKTESHMYCHINFPNFNSKYGSPVSLVIEANSGLKP